MPRPLTTPAGAPPAVPLPAVTLALLLDHRGATGLAAVLDEELAPAHPADRCDELALDALHDDPGRAGGTVVLLSIRPDPPGRARPAADRAAWERARHRHEVAGVPLADWLVVGGGRVRSLADRGASTWS